jgi:hypothetical protein
MFLAASAGCAGGSSAPGGPGPGDDPGSGGSVATGGRATGGSPATGGSTATGGTASGGTGAGTGGASGGQGAGGGGGAPRPDAADPAARVDGAGDAGAVAQDAAPAPDAAGPPPGPVDYGGVGQRPSVPLLYTATPVPPLVEPECPGDPTAGFTEYPGTFVVQRPNNLAAADRMKYENGIYTFWVQSNDQAHQPNNTTEPRTEARYANFNSGEHLWSADVMYEQVSRTCIMQIHNVTAAIAMYVRVQGNRMFNLSTGTTLATNYNNKWFNLKVAFNTQTSQVRIFINNCLKETSRAPSGSPDWYFKNGVYTCDSGTCRSNFKNVHLYRR